MRRLLKSIGPAVGLLAIGLPAHPLMAGAPVTEVQYFHLDGLGSVRAMSDANGQLILTETHDYLAFGEEWCVTAPCSGVTAGQPKRFTGKERDAETGLDYFGARYYRAGLARFTTVDPVVSLSSSLVDPQRWNRYAYARSNPFRYMDEDGRVVRLADLSGGQQTTVINDLNTFTGDTYEVDANGNLAFVRAGANGSTTSQTLLADAIASSNIYNVTAHEGRSLWFGDSNSRTNIIRLDFADFNRLEYGKVAPAAFNLGGTLVHELVHLHLGLGDPEIDADKTTGPTVDFVNQIHRERGLPIRPHYSAEMKGLFRKRLHIAFQGADPNAPDEISHVKARPE